MYSIRPSIQTKTKQYKAKRIGFRMFSKCTNETTRERRATRVRDSFCFVFKRKRLHKLNSEEGNQHKRKNEHIECRRIFYFISREKEIRQAKVSLFQKWNVECWPGHFLIPLPIDLLVAVRLAKNCRKQYYVSLYNTKTTAKLTILNDVELCCSIRRLHPSRRWCMIKTARESLMQTTYLNVANTTKHTDTCLPHRVMHIRA